jgi:hypothetical protein
MTKEEDEERKAHKGWREAPLAPVAFMLLGNTVLKFAFALFALGFGFSIGKLSGALLDLVMGVMISCGLIWFFARLKSRKRGSAQK